MLEDVVIIGVVMLVVEAIKLGCTRRGVSEDAQKRVIVPFCVLTFAAALNVAGAWVWAPDQFWREALKQGIVLGAVASGAYSLGKSILGKS